MRIPKSKVNRGKPRRPVKCGEANKPDRFIAGKRETSVRRFVGGDESDAYLLALPACQHASRLEPGGRMSMQTGFGLSSNDAVAGDPFASCGRAPGLLSRRQLFAPDDFARPNRRAAILGSLTL